VGEPLTMSKPFYTLYLSVGTEEGVKWTRYRNCISKARSSLIQLFTIRKSRQLSL